MTDDINTFNGKCMLRRVIWIFNAFVLLAHSRDRPSRQLLHHLTLELPSTRDVKEKETENLYNTIRYTTFYLYMYILRRINQVSKNTLFHIYKISNKNIQMVILTIFRIVLGLMSLIVSS